MNLKKIFDGLSGVWKFKRHLFNTKTKTLLGSVVGIAEFTKQSEGKLFYKEQGEFTSDAGIYDVTREYFFIMQESKKLTGDEIKQENKNTKEEERIEKFFSEKGKKTGLMYALDFHQKNSNSNDILATGTHKCSEDIYEATYKFNEGESFSELSLVYKVIGPNKDYTSETTYSKKSIVGKNK